MKDEILAKMNDPKQLERLYRTDKVHFKREFTELYPNIKDNAVAEFWNQRLNYESEEINWGTTKELTFVIIISLAAGVIAKLPAILNINEDFFYPRNMGFIIFPELLAYFAWKNKLTISKVAFISCLSLAGLLFINFLPDVKKSDTLILSCVHLLLFLWAILGFAFAGGSRNNSKRWLGYLKYNGDLIVMTTLIAIAGAIMSGITIGLFSLIGFTIERFWFENVVVFALPAAPIIGTYLIQTNPQLVGKVSPVIARIFSPLVLVMLVIYLIAVIYSGKSPYNDREFLLIFNVLLVGVMALLFFSVSESSRPKSAAEVWVLILLSAITIIVNGVALSAIVFRISELGITPNRVAVLGTNILILINLLLVTTQLLWLASKKADITRVERSIVSYLPVYFLWAIVVTFLFPFLFGFR